MLFARILGVNKVVENLKKAQPAFHAGVTSVMRKILIDLQTHVKHTKLSGDPLHVRTDRLRSSINWEIENESNQNTDTIVGKVGTGVDYAAIHEYGFFGIEHVREHLRRIRTHSKTVLRSVKIGGTPRPMKVWYQRRNKVTGETKMVLKSVKTDGKLMPMKVWYRKRGKLTGDTVKIRAHDRFMAMPERSFLRSSLEERRAIIHEDLKKALDEVVRRVNKP